jgi:GR25 family glycosyltransferase involved in LPS biosynthesis
MITDDNKDAYFSGIDAIYWINLDRSERRRDAMTELLDDPAFSSIPLVERVSASDGTDPEIYSQLKNYVETDENPDAPGIYGCLLSHMRIMKLISDRTDEIVFVLEDDATLEYKPYWREPIEDALKNAPADWEIIQLAVIPGNGAKMPATRFAKTLPRKMWSTLAYLIRRSAAQKFVWENMRNETFILDKTTDVGMHAADVYLFTKLKTYHYKYPYITYPMKNDSEISEKAVRQHIHPKKIVDKHMFADE